MGRIDLVGQNLQSQTAAAVSRLVATSDDARRTVISSVEMAIDKARANFVEKLRELAREFTDEMTAANLKALDGMSEHVNVLSSRIHDDFPRPRADRQQELQHDARGAAGPDDRSCRGKPLDAHRGCHNEIVQIEKQMAARSLPNWWRSCRRRAGTSRRCPATSRRSPKSRARMARAAARDRAGPMSPAEERGSSPAIETSAKELDGRREVRFWAGDMGEVAGRAQFSEAARGTYCHG